MTKTRLSFGNRKEWLNARKDGIGASEVGTIIGLNPFETPYQLWRRKKGIDAPKVETEAMRDGHFLEGAIADYFGSVTGSYIMKNSVEDFMFVNKEKPFLRVSPDRLYWTKDSKHNEAMKCVLECKSTSKNIDADNIPKYWFAQLQMNLGVGEYNKGAIAWFNKVSGKFSHNYYSFIPDFYAWLVEEVERFWTDYIIGNKEPEVVSVEDAVLKYATHTDGKIIEVGSEIYEVYKTLKDVKAEIAKLDERKEAMEDKLKLAFGDAEAISFGGETLATWKAPKPSDKLDTKKLKELHPDVIAECTTQVQGSRRLLIK